jgi:hypothetical protein
VLYRYTYLLDVYAEVRDSRHLDFSVVNIN